MLVSKIGATPLYLAIILARANAYSRASATLRMSGTVSISSFLILYIITLLLYVEQ